MTSITEVQKETMDLLITLRELEVLEDYDGADYTAVLSDLQWNHYELKERLTTLQRRKNV